MRKSIISHSIVLTIESLYVKHLELPGIMKLLVIINWLAPSPRISHSLTFFPSEFSSVALLLYFLLPLLFSPHLKPKSYFMLSLFNFLLPNHCENLDFPGKCNNRNIYLALCGRQCAKCFTWINSSNSHNSLMR